MRVAILHDHCQGLLGYGARQSSLTCSTDNRGYRWMLDPITERGSCSPMMAAMAAEVIIRPACAARHRRAPERPAKKSADEHRRRYRPDQRPPDPRLHRQPHRPRHIRRRSWWHGSSVVISRSAKQAPFPLSTRRVRVRVQVPQAPCLPTKNFDCCQFPALNGAKPARYSGRKL